MKISKHTVRTRSLTVITEAKNEVLEDAQKTIKIMKRKINWKQLAIEVLRLAITLLIGDNVIN